MNIISRKLPKFLFDAYMNDSLFHDVVTRHEIEGSSYELMLEHAVEELIKRDKETTNKLLEYIERYGALI